MTTQTVHSGVLESPDDFQSAEDVHDAVGVVLVESLPSTDEDTILTLCSRLYSILIGQDGDSGDKVTAGASGDKATADDGKKLLDAPVHLAAKLKDQGVYCLMASVANTLSY